MFKHRPVHSAFLSALAVVFVAAACSESNPAAPQPGARNAAVKVNAGAAAFGLIPNVLVCKQGSDGTFTVLYDDGTQTTSTVTVPRGTCVEVASIVLDPAVVTVTEVVPAGFQLDSIVKDSLNWSVADSIRLAPVTGTLTGTVHLTGDPPAVGGILTFYNSPTTAGGGQGCTPGYWKQKQHFHSYTAPYTPNTLFGSVFANAFPNKTFLQVLGTGGGGLNALGRHTVAALLSAASANVSFNLSVAQVIAAFNAAYASGNYEQQKNIFAAYNEQVCPLN
jgi:hypothetical protein